MERARRGGASTYRNGRWNVPQTEFCFPFPFCIIPGYTFFSSHQYFPAIHRGGWASETCQAIHHRAYFRVFDPDFARFRLKFTLPICQAFEVCSQHTRGKSFVKCWMKNRASSKVKKNIQKVSQNKFQCGVAKKASMRSSTSQPGIPITVRYPTGKLVRSIFSPGMCKGGQKMG